MSKNSQKLSRRKFLGLSLKVTTVALLTACTPPPEPKAPTSQATQAPPKPTSVPPTSAAVVKPGRKLRWWGGVPEINGPKQATEAWNKANPDIQAEYIQYSNNDEGNTKLETALLVQDEVDIFVNHGLARFITRAQSGLMEPLNGYLGNLDPKKDFGASPNNIGDKVFGMVVSQMPNYVFLNKNAFEEAGLKIPTDWTWDEFMAASSKLNKGTGAQKRFGTFFNGTYSTEMVYLRRGGDFLYKEKCVSNFDDPLFKWALGTRLKMQDNDKSAIPFGDITAGKLQPSNSFLSGQTAMLVEGAWILRYFKDLKGYPRDFIVSFAPIPHAAEEPNQFRAGSAEERIALSSKTKFKDASWKFMRWYSTEGYNYMTPFGRFPYWKGIQPEEVTKSFLSDFVDAEKYIETGAFKTVTFDTKRDFAFRTNMTAAAEMDQVYTEEVQKMLLGSATIDNCITNMKKRADEQLQKLCK